MKVIYFGITKCDYKITILFFFFVFFFVNKVNEIFQMAIVYHTYLRGYIHIIIMLPLLKTFWTSFVQEGITGRIENPNNKTVSLLYTWKQGFD